MLYPSKDIGFPLLVFLWKWKVATTSALAIRFFPKMKITSAHRRLLELAKGGYVRTLCSHTGRGHVWTLTDKGFSAIRDRLPDLEQVGYKSEAIGHDILSMAAMMGDWLTETPSGVITYSEQLLRCVDHKLYPMWVPQSDRHRSDGYWRLPKLPQDHSIALEVERSQKKLSLYDLVADFYENYEFVTNVVWITPFSGASPSIEARIKSSLKTAQTKHLFLPLQEFAKLGWQAKFRDGKYRNQSLSDYLCAWAAPAQREGDGRCLLETRKKPLELNPSKISDDHAFFN